MSGVGNGMRQRQEVYAHIIGKNGIEVPFISGNGGQIDLVTNGYSDDNGFFVVLSPTATEGLLYVKFWNSNVYQLYPFFIGRNPILVKSVQVSVSQTATEAYWEK